MKFKAFLTDVMHLNSSQIPTILIEAKLLAIYNAASELVLDQINRFLLHSVPVACLAVLLKQPRCGYIRDLVCLICELSSDVLCI